VKVVEKVENSKKLGFLTQIWSTLFENWSGAILHPFFVLGSLKVWH
jgi:hypothetical protein